MYKVTWNKVHQNAILVRDRQTQTDSDRQLETEMAMDCRSLALDSWSSNF